MATFVVVAIGGAAIGAIYAVVALGFVLVFKTTGTVNFAHPALMLVGAYTTFQLGPQRWGSSFLVAALLAVCLTALAGLALHRFVVNPLTFAPVHAVILATVGIDLSLRAGIGAQDDWVLDQRSIGAPWNSTVEIAGGTFPESHLWVIGLSAIVVTALTVFVQRTRWGLRMKATAEDQEVALAQGISVRQLIRGVWMLAAALAAIGGILASVHPRTLNPAVFIVGIRALPAAVVGGFSSLPGAVIGGLAIGWVEVFTSVYQPDWLGANFHLVLPYIVMLLVLLVRPEGLLGDPEVVRV